MKKTLFISVILCSILFIGGCSFLDEVDKDIKESTKPKVSCKTTKQYKGKGSYSYYIEGTCTNEGKKDYDYIQVEYICYDKQGNNLGTAIDNTNNLLSGQNWKFKAVSIFDDVKSVDHCDFHEVTGW